jgi:hypothetical protein
MIEMPELQRSYSQITRVSSFGHFDPVACSQPPLESLILVYFVAELSWNNLAATAPAVFVLLQVAVQQ